MHCNKLRPGPVEPETEILAKCSDLQLRLVKLETRHLTSSYELLSRRGVFEPVKPSQAGGLFKKLESTWAPSFK